MTKEAIDQIYDRARHGDVFAQALMGQILIEGKNVQKDVQNGIGWMKNAAQCNCLYAKEYLDEMRRNLLSTSNQQNSKESGAIGASQPHIDYSAELSNLVGLSQVKEDVESLRNLIKVQALRK